MSNLTCASIDELDRLKSFNFVLSQFVDVLAAAVTLSSTYTAVTSVLKKSIFQLSTKILLIQSLFYANVYQLSYSLEAVILIYKHCFMIDKICEILQTEAHCKFYIYIILAATSGMIYGQTALMIERACATFMRNYRRRRSSYIGVLLFVLVSLCSSFTGPLLLWDDPLDRALLGCFMFPRLSAAESTVYFFVCTVLVFFNLAVSLFLKIYNKKLEYKIRFKVGARFVKRECIDSTGTVCFLTLSVFVLMVIYTVGIGVLRNIRSYLTVSEFYFWVVWFYTVPFFAMLIPLVLVYRIRLTHSNRVQSIIGITQEKQTVEDHIKQMKSMWE